MPQPPPIRPSPSESLTPNSLQPSATAKTVDPYAPAPNLVRVERIRDVNTGQDVFIRWVSDTHPTASEDPGQQHSQPQQIYSSRPPATQQAEDDELPDEIERLALDDEYLRKSLHVDQRTPSRQSKKRSKKGKRRDIDYEVIEGFFEDRQGKKRPVKLERARINTIKDSR